MNRLYTKMQNTDMYKGPSSIGKRPNTAFSIHDMIRFHELQLLLLVILLNGISNLVLLVLMNIFEVLVLKFH